MHLLYSKAHMAKYEHKLVTYTKVSKKMHRLKQSRAQPRLGPCCSKLIIVKNLKSNKRVVSVKEQEPKLDLKQSIPTTAESCNA